MAFILWLLIGSQDSLSPPPCVVPPRTRPLFLLVFGGIVSVTNPGIHVGAGVRLSHQIENVSLFYSRLCVKLRLLFGFEQLLLSIPTDPQSVHMNTLVRVNVVHPIILECKQEPLCCSSSSSHPGDSPGVKPADPKDQGRPSQPGS